MIILFESFFPLHSFIYSFVLVLFFSFQIYQEKKKEVENRSNYDYYWIIPLLTEDIRKAKERNKEFGMCKNKNGKQNK